MPVVGTPRVLPGPPNPGLSRPRARREGAVRADVSAGNLAVLLALVLRPLPGGLKAIAERTTERTVALVLDGLRPQRTAPLPGAPVPLRNLTPPGP